VKLWGFRPRGTGRVHQDYVPPPAAEVNEMRLMQLQVRVQDAERIIRDHMRAQAELYPEDRDDATADVLLEVLVALGAAPAADPEPPVIPGASS